MCPPTMSSVSIERNKLGGRELLYTTVRDNSTSIMRIVTSLTVYVVPLLNGSFSCSAV